MGSERSSEAVQPSARRISTHAAVQEEIVRLRERVAALEADRADWLTVLAHELRTPLTIISGYNRLLLSGEAGPLTAEQARYLEESTRSCKRLDAFVASLLDSAHDGFLEERLETGAGDLGVLVDDVCGLLRPLIDQKGLELVVDVAADARRARFDPLRIEQVVTNLLGNAIRYTKPGGSLRVETRRRGGRDGAVLEVAVHDQGPGIPAADRERVFEPFVRLASDDRGGAGLGLGLAICRRIVAAHGGAIGVDEAAGGGCRFHFTLPAATAGSGER